jgi:hypothetical protein
MIAETFGSETIDEWEIPIILPQIPAREERLETWKELSSNIEKESNLETEEQSSCSFKQKLQQIRRKLQKPNTKFKKRFF